MQLVETHITNSKEIEAICIKSKLLYNIFDINSDFKYSGIYKITNVKNRKVYIGQSQCLYIRFKKYQKLNSINKHLKSAILKDGIDNFKVEILELNIPVSQLDFLEEKYIEQYKSFDRLLVIIYADMQILPEEFCIQKELKKQYRIKLKIE